MKISHPFTGEAVIQTTLMNSTLELVSGSHPQLTKPAFLFMESLVEQLNFFSKTSELTRLHNQPRQEWHPVSSALFDVLTLGKELEKETKGWFCLGFEGYAQNPDGDHRLDLQLPNLVRMGQDSRINLGGIGKGFIVDQTASFLEKNGVDTYLVNAGGDIRAKSSSHPWVIGLQNPQSKSAYIGTLSVKAGAVVTSGTYSQKRVVNGAQHSHFFNPFTNTFIKMPPYLSVTAQGPSAARSEVWAKCVLMGFEGTLPKHYRFVVIDSQTTQISTLNAEYFF